jgi:hypothetical protein
MNCATFQSKVSEREVMADCAASGGSVSVTAKYWQQLGVSNGGRSSVSRMPFCRRDCPKRGVARLRRQNCHCSPTFAVKTLGATGVKRYSEYDDCPRSLDP